MYSVKMMNLVVRYLKNQPPYIFWSLLIEILSALISPASEKELSEAYALVTSKISFFWSFISLFHYLSPWKCDCFFSKKHSFVKVAPLTPLAFRFSSRSHFTLSVYNLIAIQ